MPLTNAEKIRMLEIEIRLKKARSNIKSASPDVSSSEYQGGVSNDNAFSPAVSIPENEASWRDFKPSDILSAAKNIPSWAGNTIAGVAHGLASPLESGRAMLGMPAGIVEAAQSYAFGDDPTPEAQSVMGMVEQYSPDRIRKTVVENPGQFLMDIQIANPALRLLGMGGKVARAIEAVDPIVAAGKGVSAGSRILKSHSIRPVHGAKLITEASMGAMTGAGSGTMKEVFDIGERAVPNVADAKNLGIWEKMKMVAKSRADKSEGSELQAFHRARFWMDELEHTRNDVYKAGSAIKREQSLKYREDMKGLKQVRPVDVEKVKGDILKVLQDFDPNVKFPQSEIETLLNEDRMLKAHLSSGVDVPNMSDKLHRQMLAVKNISGGNARVLSRDLSDFVNNIDLSKTAFSKGEQGRVKSFVKRALEQRHDNMTAVDSFVQNLDSMIERSPLMAPNHSRFNAFASRARDAIAGELHDAVPGLADVKREYMETNNFLDNVAGIFSTESKNPETMMGKLAESLNDKAVRNKRRELIRSLEEKGASNLAAKIAGFATRPIMGSGIAGRIMGQAAIGASIGAPLALATGHGAEAVQMAIGGLGGLAVTSPRAMGKVLSELGVMKGHAKNLMTIFDEIHKSLPEDAISRGLTYTQVLDRMAQEGRQNNPQTTNTPVGPGARIIRSRPLKPAEADSNRSRMPRPFTIPPIGLMP